MANFYLNPLSTFMTVLNNSGLALTNCLIYTYTAGTTTPATTYTDSTGGTPNSNPVQLTVGGNLSPGINIWQPAGVKLKVQFWTNAGTVGSPVQGTQIGPTFDQVAGIGDVTTLNNSYWGGLDGGAANAYVLTSVANITAYANGQTFVWVPNNTNTTASTLNVNAIGVINILNAAGGALVAGQLVAGSPAQVTYYAGSFYLLNPTVNLSSSFTATITGTAAATTGTVQYRITSAGIVTLFVAAQIQGLSNSTSCTMTGLPVIIQPKSEQFISGWGLIRSGVVIFGMHDVGTSGTIIFSSTVGSATALSYSATGFVNDNASKGVAQFWQIMYSLN